MVGIDAANEEATSDSITLVDEADSLFIDELNSPPSASKACFGFTATIPSGENDYEHERLAALGFKIWNEEVFGYEAVDPEIDFKVPDWKTFFERTTRGAKLVFGSLNDANRIAQVATDAGFQTKVDSRDFNLIRNMSDWCLIVTEEKLMRGIDYRVRKLLASAEKEDGIDLLICAPFNNKRARKQGLGRVGRGQEPCTRVQLEGIEDVNMESEGELQRKLGSRIVKHK